jgi:predicted GH43/DUF377 family glycosyl hydrolase
MMGTKRVVLTVVAMLCAAGVALAQTEWVQYPDNRVIGPGEPGAWDGVARTAGSVILVGSTYHMWFVGADTSTGAGDSIGHSTSTDGVEWTVDPANPVLTPGGAGEWDEFGLWLPSVVHDGTQFHMWYSGFGGGGIVRGGYATSPDGSVWTKHPDNPVMDLGPAGSWEDRHVRPGGVVQDGGTFKMWYSGWGTNTNVQIGYAESDDGVHWTRNPDPVIGEIYYPGVWDSRACNPSVLFDGHLYHMWYAGYEPSIGDWSVGYAFSTDGIAWDRHRDNPVLHVEGLDIVSMPVSFDGSTWHMWPSSQGFIAYATSNNNSPGVAALDRYQYIPAAALASGAAGSFYETDLDLSNAGDQPIEYQLKWLPRGEDCSDPMTSDVFSLGAGMSVRYMNVLAEVFQLQPDSLGALAVASTSPDLLAMSRTYNIPSTEVAGTFGQAMPGVPTDDFIRYGDRRRILFGTENVDMRTNVGCQAASDGVAVRMELFDMEGTSLASETLVLRPWGNDQVNRIFEDFTPITGYVDVWTPMSGGAFYCYGSVLDNVTSDPTTILPQ